MSKSADAFRTISEVADWLGVHAHVLRFWESKFTQIKPVKRAGGRRYYRPVDMLLLGGIQKLLHEDGLTIKGVQKILREKGMAHVSALSKGLDDADGTVAKPAATTSPAPARPAAAVPPPEAPSAMDVAPSDKSEENVVDFMSANSGDATDADTNTDEQRPSFTEDAVVMPDAAPSKAEAEPPTSVETTPEPTVPDAATSGPTSIEPEPVVPAPVEQNASAEEDPVPQDKVEVEPKEAPAPTVEPETPSIPAFMSSAAKPAVTPETPDEASNEAPESDPVVETTAPAAPALPSFLHRREPDATSGADASLDATAEAPEAAPAEPQAPKPQIIDIPETPDESGFSAAPSVLSALSKTKSLSATQAKDITPILAQLVALRDRMVQARKE